MSDSYELLDIVQAIHKSTLEIEGFIAGLNADLFFRDIRVQRAVMFDLVIIGEACRDIERFFPQTMKKHPDLPIRIAYGMRNRLVHAYLEYDLNIVWITVSEDVPKLRAIIERVELELE